MIVRERGAAIHAKFTPSPGGGPGGRAAVLSHLAGVACPAACMIGGNGEGRMHMPPRRRRAG